MISSDILIPCNEVRFDPTLLQKGTWLALLHVQRIPPHVGVIFNGHYHSLTIREKESGIALDALLKTISMRKIKAVFVKIKPHPVFSIEYCEQVFAEILQSSDLVSQNGPTCLTPVRQYFKEFYAVCESEQLLFEFMQTLQVNDYLEKYMALNIEMPEGLILPLYSALELKERILNERNNLI